MSEMKGVAYSPLINQLNRRSFRAVLSQLGFQSKPLNKYLEGVWSNNAGISGSFLADPVFESTFGYKTANKTLKQLSGKLIEPALINALDKPPREYRDDYTFPKERLLYTHQLSAWSRLISEKPSSVLVSSGTGSGKTECFLIPILNDLIRQSQENLNALEGVQALFLYPLNALIESQQERLSAWSRLFGGDIRYCLYNGNTPPSQPPVDVQRKKPEQVMSRSALRSSPPPILVTNSSMLEYMLVRQDDQPILEKSQGKLKWIVLDEAHTYIGSNAAEIAILLRRVMHSFAVNPSDVRFVATSATLGSNDEKTLSKLQAFLSDVAGVDPSQVHVITGGRDVPSIDIEPLPDTDSIDTITSWVDLPAEERWEKVSHSRFLRGLRNFLTGGKVAQKTLTEITAYLTDYMPAISRSDALEVLDLCAMARDDQGDAFLPTRLHLFEKTLGGIWSCVNDKCSGRTNTDLDDVEWRFGKVFIHHRDHCDCCQMPVYEILSCSDCGAEYLSAQEVKKGHEYFLKAYSPNDGADEFQLDIDFDESEETDVCEESRRLISSYGGDRKDWVSENGLITESGKTSPQSEVDLISPDDGRLWCACCGSKDSPKFSKFRLKKLGAPFFLGDILPTVLEHCPPGEGSERSGPAEGRRLLTFTDSRQGTARIAARLQQDTDRNYVRSLLYQQLSPVRGQVSSVDIPEDIDNKIKEYKQHLQANLPAHLKQTVEDGLQKLCDLKASAGSTTIELPSLSWQEAIQALTHSREIRHWMRDNLSRLSGVTLSEEEFANFCLFREFARRPKRGNQSETLGLIKLVYPKIESITKRPDQWLEWGGSLDDWKDFLSIFIDHHIRASSSINIDRRFTGWMGSKIRVQYVQSPHKLRVSGQSNIIYWPKLGTRRGRVPRMAGLLLEGFELDRKEESVRRTVNHILEQAWDAIYPCLDSVGDGYLLNFQSEVELTGLTNAWRCPYTMRLLPRSFKGLSPYTVVGDGIGRAVKCDSVEMPVLPYRHWRDEKGKDIDPIEIRDWIDADEKIEKLRSRWLWPNRSDRAAEGEMWIAVGEHSAQQSKSVLDRLSTDFKAGKMNVLSCSTTMEMGVDIGGMSAIAMNNVPPGQANYLQRAGRAGRRKESSSVCVTLCGQTAHGIDVFNNPLWPFDPEGISVPRVALHSRSLVQRHANAFLLSEWLKRSGLDIPKLNCGWFYEESMDEIRANSFRAWCETLHESDQALVDSLKSLIKGTALASSTPMEITTGCAEVIDRLNIFWQREYGELRERLGGLTKASDPDKNRVPIRAINFQLKALRSEYLLKDLTSKGFLPGHGFPSGIVTLLTSTQDDFRRQTDPSSDTREDVSVQRSTGPTRDRSIGIREFAPGAEIVVNGVVHRSDGITLNRHIPAHIEGRQEIQDINWHWHCQSCGSGDISNGRPESCSACESNELKRRQVISPNGFAVDLRYERHNDVSAPTYLPYNPPRVNFGGAHWKSFSDPMIGRIRSTEQASIMHWNAGSHDNAGYAVCFYCGRAAMQVNSGELPSVFRSPHRRLRGGKESEYENYCPGSDSEWAIKRDLWLVDESVTSAIELQLRHPVSGAGLSDDTIAWSVAYALRHGLVRALGITESEVSVRVQKFINANLELVQSIFLYDSAVSGAGYVTQFTDYMDEILVSALELFECPDQCDSACNACLVSWDSQHQRDSLDRIKGREFLAGWKQRLILPDEYRILGDGSQVELKALSESIRNVSYKARVDEVSFFLGGDADQWDLSHWSMLKEINRWIDDGIKVYLFVDTGSFDSLSDSQKRILSSLISLGEGSLIVGKLGVSNVLTDNSNLLIALSGEKPMVWAGMSPELVPGDQWSYSERPHIKASIEMPSLPFEVVSDEQLLGSVNTPDLKLKVRLSDQCDGRLSEFGEKFWKLLSEIYPGSDDSAIRQIYYRDRYLCSPLHTALLAQILSVIGDRMTDDAEILMDTMELKDPRYQPSAFNDNWGSDNARAKVVSKVLGEITGCSKIDIRSYARKSIAHSRELKVEFESGASLEIFLDEGVSCWRLNGYKTFDFAAAPSSQARTILKLDGYIAMAHKRVGSWMFVSKE